MLPAAKNPLVTSWFRGYTRRYLRRSFHRVLIHGSRPALPPGPLLVCSNHSSWWDLLLAFWLCEDLLGWDAWGPMDVRQLRRYPILRRIGVFGVDRESLAGGRMFLEYARALLAGRRRVLWLTAQGAMVSPEVRPVRLYSGPARLAEALGDCHVLTVALDYAFWEERRPEALVSWGTPWRVRAGEPGFSHRAVHHALEAELESRLELLGELRRERDPGRFQVALAGVNGISPAYDALRRAQGWWRRVRLPREHGAVRTPPRWGPGARLP
jgi:1-acyl-sn-glycerol-3-phosphate acyltransferase